MTKIDSYRDEMEQNSTAFFFQPLLHCYFKSQKIARREKNEAQFATRKSMKFSIVNSGRKPCDFLDRNSDSDSR